MSACGVPLNDSGLAARRVADDLVHVGGQLAAERPETSPRASASSGDHANSLRIAPACDLS